MSGPRRRTRWTRPPFTMEYVEGTRLARLVQQHGASCRCAKAAKTSARRRWLAARSRKGHGQPTTASPPNLLLGTRGDSVISSTGAGAHGNGSEDERQASCSGSVVDGFRDADAHMGTVTGPPTSSRPAEQDQLSTGPTSGPTCPAWVYLLLTAGRHGCTSPEAHLEEARQQPDGGAPSPGDVRPRCRGSAAVVRKLDGPKTARTGRSLPDFPTNLVMP